MIIKLMDYRSIYTKEVEINEGDRIVIQVLTGDWVMQSPIEVDSSNDRILSFYDGMVEFIATKNNIDKINNCKYSSEIFNLDFEGEVI